MGREKYKTAPHKGFLGILYSASDWYLKFDLDGMLKVPVFLKFLLFVQIYYYFLFSKKVIIIDLTYPCEKNMNQCHEKSLRNTIDCVVQLDLMAGLLISMLKRLALGDFVLSQLEVTFVA